MASDSEEFGSTVRKVLSVSHDESLRHMRDVRLPKNLTVPNPIGPGEVSPTIISIAKHGSYSVGDLADILDRSHQSIGKSIRRLRAQGKIELDRGGFRLK